MPELPHKRFQRTIEDFVCAQCDQNIEGDGFTNHCPHCLWSKHVDTHPGDRSCSCEGLMKPTAVEIAKGEHIILHTCTKCGFQRRNQTHTSDNFNKLLEIAKDQNNK